MRFAGKRTMKVAQELYEGIDVDGSGPVGLITYMRTDSLSVSQEAMQSVRDLIATQYGEKYLPSKPIRYAAGKNCAGGSRGHPAHRSEADAREDQEPSQPRPVPALPVDLRTIRRQPDGARRLHRDRRGYHRRRRVVQGPGQGAQVRRLPQSLAAGRKNRGRAVAGARRGADARSALRSTPPSISPSRRPDTARRL